MKNCPESVVLERSPCPSGCTDHDDREVVVGRDRLHDIPGDYAVVRCGTCSLLRTQPRPTAGTIGLYYPADYGPYHAAPPRAGSPVSGFKRWLRDTLGLETRCLPLMQPGRLLEIGCASGQYLEQMQRSGWTVEGIEFSDDAAQRARSRGLAVRTGTVEQADAPVQPVDVVAAWMVLEHLHEPVAALAKIRTWVKPGGYLVASVPDAGSWLRGWFGSRWYALHLPNHLYHYSPQTMALVLRRAGWELQQVTWQKNSSNLLGSMVYLARDRRWHRLANGLQWLKQAPASSKARILIGWILGVTHQSGSMEIRAQAMPRQGEST